MESQQTTAFQFGDSVKLAEVSVSINSQRRLRQMMATTALTLLIGFGALGFASAANAAEDSIESKLKPGLTIDAVVALIGSAPDAESCRTTLGIRTCRLVWVKFFSDRRYEVDFLWGRLVSVQSCRNMKTSCSSSEAE